MRTKTLDLLPRDVRNSRYAVTGSNEITAALTAKRKRGLERQVKNSLFM